MNGKKSLRVTDIFLLVFMLVFFGQLYVLFGVQEARALTVANGDGLVIYGQTANTTPRWRTYTDTTNSFSVTTGTVAGAVGATFVMRTSPIKQEAIAGYVTPGGVLRVMCYNGVSWSEDWTVTVGGTGTTRRFDIAYETGSGDVMVLYSTNTASTNELAYRVKPGSSGCGVAQWASATNLNPARTSGIVQWVTMAWDRRAGQNLITAIWADANADLSAMVWSGTVWGNEPSTATETSLEFVAAAQDVDDFDVEYESVSGDVMVVWANSAGNNNTNGVRYRLCTGGIASCTWGAVTTPPTFRDDATNLDISANPDTDEIVFASIGNAGSDLQVGYWSGSAWTNTANRDTSAATPLAGTHLVSTGWLISGATKRSVIVYNDSNATSIGWVVGNNGSFAIQTDFTPTPPLGNPRKWLSVETDPIQKDRLMYSLSDVNRDLFVKRLVMTASPAFTWTNADGGAALETNLQQATVGDFAFAYWRFIPAFITISGTVYSDAGITPVTSAVKVAVNGVQAYSVSTLANGSYSVSDISRPATSSVITAWMDNNGGGNGAGTVVTKYSGSGNLTGFNMYKNRLILRHEDVGQLKNSDIMKCDSATTIGPACNGDSDLHFDVNEATQALGVLSDTILYVWSGNTFSPHGAVMLDAGGSGGDVFVAPIGVFDIATSTLAVGGGDLSINGTFSQAVTATTTLQSSGNLSGSGTITFGTLVVGTSTSAATTTVLSDITVGGALVITTSSRNNVINAGSATITLLGGGMPFIIGGNGVFNSGVSTVIYKGTIATRVAAATYNDLQLEPATLFGPYTLGAGTTVIKNTFTVGNGLGVGVVSGLLFDTPLSVGGTMTIASGTIFEAPGTSAISVQGDLVIQGGFTGSGGTLVFNGIVPQSVSGVSVPHFSDVTVSNAQGVTFQQDVFVDRNLVINTNAKLTAPSGNLTIGGDYVNSGSFINNNGTITAGGTVLQNFSGAMGGVSGFNVFEVTNNSGSDPIVSPSVILRSPADAVLFKVITGGAKIQFATSTTYTFNGINLNSATTPIYLRSTSLNSVESSDSWSLIAGAAQTVSNVDVQNSFACGGTTITATDPANRDSRNNSCWKFKNGFSISGTLFSHIIDTLVQGGVSPNTILWRGTMPVGTQVKFQIASSNSTNGPWDFIAWNGFFCSSTASYAGLPEKQIEIKAGCHANQRYIRYKVILETTDSTVTPTVDEIVLNYAK